MFNLLPKLLQSPGNHVIPFGACKSVADMSIPWPSGILIFKSVEPLSSLLMEVQAHAEDWSLVF